MQRLIAIAILLFAAPAAEALEVRFQPADVVYVYESKGVGTPLGYYTAVLQNIAIVNDGDRELDVQSARIDVIAGGDVVQSREIARGVMEAMAQRFNAYQEHGALDLYDFHFQTRGYLQGISFAPEPVLKNGQAVVIMHQPLLLYGVPDEIKVTVKAWDSEGAVVTAHNSVRAEYYNSPNLYGFPVEGRWVAMAAPSLHSHHRWASIQEFALDLIQFGADGLTHEVDGTKVAQYYCYGQRVVAASAGEVVAASGDMDETDDSLQLPGESSEAYEQRVGARQQELLAQGFEYAMGNHVIIDHGGGEFSHYLHLQKGSVEVAVGDKVARGQRIGSVGQSGNSTEPHLHFHLTNGPDMARSRSLPVVFQNIRLWPDDDSSIRHIQSGQVVITIE